MMVPRPVFVSVSLALILLFHIEGCARSGRGGATAATALASAPAAPVQFVDVAESLGVRFKHTNGASGAYLFPETMGAGCAVLDYDGDGRLDLFLVNSGRLPGFKEKGPFYPALYRQRPDGSFEERTKEAGLAVEGYGTGCAVADYDNDGDPDLYLTGLGVNILFRNEGNGTFTDVTAAAGAENRAWGSSAAWFDYDRDGDLDLFIANYCRWSPAENRSCGDGTGRYICGPKFYRGAASVLFRNEGNGTLRDVTRAAGVHNTDGKALGVVVWDYDGDGWLDFAVANDTVPNWLYRNNRDGTFTEVGVEVGLAYSTMGLARAGMGIDTIDIDGSGRESVVIGNNTSEGLALFRPEPDPSGGGSVRYLDAAEELGIFHASLPFSTFGAMAVDLDLDGYTDIVTVNGHVNQHVARLGGFIDFPQRLQWFRNEPGPDGVSRIFRDLGGDAGPGMSTPRVGRGLAVGDVDGDGDIDLLVVANDGPAALLQNEGGNRNHWLGVRLRGVKSNRDGIGTRLVLQSGDRSQTAWVRSGSSYCSANELAARFGLGAATRADRLTLHWPSGITQTIGNIPADQLLQVTEPKR
jgi:hypothetical protein